MSSTQDPLTAKPAVRRRAFDRRSVCPGRTCPAGSSENASSARPDETGRGTPERSGRRPVTGTETGASAPAIQAQDFSLWYGSTVGVADVTIDIYPRSVTAIIGPSGCGKSTFLRSINRMNDLVPGARAEGRLLVNGHDVYDRRINLASLRQQVGMVFQKPNPFPKSIYDNIAYGPRLLGVRRRSHLDRTVEQSLRDAALWDEVKDQLRKSALALSGGQQQRLCIARALATGPKVLLMDEPCSALDPIATARIEDLIDRLKDHYTIVIVTHNMQQAARVSDTTAFMYLGRLIEVGPTADLFTTPRCRETEDYISGRFG